MSDPEPPAPAARQPAVVRRLGVASFFQDVASEMVFPLLPGFLATLGGGPAILGAMESAADATVAFVKGWAGRASDRARRRKPFVLFGYSASAAARPLLSLAASPLQVLALRVWDRFAKGVRSAPRDALIAGAVDTPRRAAAFAYQRGLDHLGAAVGPIVAAALLAGGTSTRAVFLLATLPALAGVATVALLPREADADRATPSPPRERAVDGIRSGLDRPAHVAAFLFGLASASDAFLLLRATELGAPVAALPILWSALHVVRWAAARRGGELAVRLGDRRALSLGWTVYALAYAGIGFVGSLAGLAGLLAIYGLLAGMIEGSERSFAASFARDERHAGTSLGAWQRSAGLGAVGASAGFGIVWQAASSAAAFGAAAAASTLAVLALARSEGATSAQR